MSVRAEQSRRPATAWRVAAAGVVAAAFTAALLVIVPPLGAVTALGSIVLWAWLHHRSSDRQQIAAGAAVGAAVMVLAYAALVALSYQNESSGSGSQTAPPTAVVRSD